MPDNIVSLFERLLARNIHMEDRIQEKFMDSIGLAEIRESSAIEVRRSGWLSNADMQKYLRGLALADFQNVTFFTVLLDGQTICTARVLIDDFNEAEFSIFKKVGDCWMDILMRGEDDFIKAGVVYSLVVERVLKAFKPRRILTGHVYLRPPQEDVVRLLGFCRTTDGGLFSKPCVYALETELVDGPVPNAVKCN